MSGYSFSRPTDPTPVQQREAVAGDCGACGAQALMRYPVLSEGGWFLVVKCQDCLHSNSRERWNRLGHITLATDTIG